MSRDYPDTLRQDDAQHRQEREFEMITDVIDEEAALEKKREEAVRLLSQYLRAKGSQTVNQYCGVAEDRNINKEANVGIAKKEKEKVDEKASKRNLSPTGQNSSSSPEKRCRSISTNEAHSPSPALIKVAGRGKGRKALTIDHSKSYVSQVYEVAQAMKWSHATFEHTRVGLPPNEMFQVSCLLNGQEYIALQATLKLKDGKELASLEALRSLMGDSP